MGKPTVIKPAFNKGSWAEDNCLWIQNIGSITLGFKAKDRELKAKSKEAWIFPTKYSLTPAGSASRILKFYIGKEKYSWTVWAIQDSVRPCSK